MALLIALASPSLIGFRSVTAMQTAARQFASDLRTAQENAVAQNTQVDIAFTVAGGAVTGYTVEQGATVLWQVTLSSLVHARTTWPGNDVAFAANGAPVGSGTGTNAALCIDNMNGLTVTVSVTLTTGRALLTLGTGTC